MTTETPRTEGLDVARLARAIHAGMRYPNVNGTALVPRLLCRRVTFEECFDRPQHEASAETVAAEYARLAAEGWA